MNENAAGLMPELSVGLVHEWLTTYAGSEKVLEAIGELRPDAPIHPLVHDRKRFEGGPIETHPIRPSFINDLPFGRRHYAWYLPLMPLAVERLDLSEFDLVISSNHAVAKGVITGPEQLHISYVHTPMRYAWDLRGQYFSNGLLRRGPGRLFAEALLHYLRQWDVASANRVDVFLANSRFVARRIWKTYRRRAQVIHPPVEVERFSHSLPRDSFYLTVGRLTPYKRVDVLIEAANQSGLPLVVIGDGPQRGRLEAVAGPTVTMMGPQPDSVVTDYLERCRALVFAAVEDFGIVPVEAQAAGAPVIALGRGGVLDSVVPGQTGLFYHEQAPRALAQALREFEHGPGWDASAIAAHAENFSKARFQAQFTQTIHEAWANRDTYLLPQ